MYGFPKHLNTKQDYLNMLAVDPEATKAALRSVLEGRFGWFPVKKLKSNENPQETDTKQIREIPVEDGEEGQVERWLYKYQEDPQAWLFRLGFTVEEAEALCGQEGE